MLPAVFVVVIAVLDLDTERAVELEFRQETPLQDEIVLIPAAARHASCGPH